MVRAVSKPVRRNECRRGGGEFYECAARSTENGEVCGHGVAPVEYDRSFERTRAAAITSPTGTVAVVTAAKARRHAGRLQYGHRIAIREKGRHERDRRWTVAGHAGARLRSINVFRARVAPPRRARKARRQR